MRISAKKSLMVVVFSVMQLLTATVTATPITSAFPGAFRDNEGASPVFTGQGDNFSIGLSGVSPGGDAGTTATATNTVTSDTLNIPSAASQGRPDIFGLDIPFATASANNELTPWNITVQNGPNSLIVTTPDRTGVQKMEFVRNLSISGPATSPTVTWQLPTGGAPFNRVRFELWNDDTNMIVSSSNLGCCATSLTLGPLALGTNYAIRIKPEQTDANGLVSRSSNWVGWNVQQALPLGQAAQLITGSPVSLTQTVDVPLDPFNLVFDYMFTTPTGVLTVLLDGIPIGTSFLASTILESEFFQAIFEIEDPVLLGLTGVPLTFGLDGPSGSTVLIDNISFPGLSNGGFSNELRDWETGGSGVISLVTVPEPSTLMLLSIGLVGLGWMGRRRTTSG